MSSRSEATDRLIVSKTVNSKRMRSEYQLRRCQLTRLIIRGGKAQPSGTTDF